VVASPPEEGRKKVPEEGRETAPPPSKVLLQSRGGTGKGTAFVPPSLADIERFISINSLSISAEVFFNYYTASGWRGVLDWESKILTWEAREKHVGHQSGQPFTKRPSPATGYDPTATQRLKEQIKTEKEKLNVP
jgi:hypothetical protein